MSDQSSFTQEVHALRVASERRDWNSCRDAVEALLLRLPTSHAVRLTRDFVARRLSVFERQQPGVHWPREFIESVGEGGPLGIERAWPEEEDDFPSPGANSFTSAVESLWKANRLMENPRQCVLELVNALSGVIIAEEDEHWGSRHPEEWALWYQLALSGESDPRKSSIRIAIATDPEVKWLERAAWLGLADQLEAALRPG